MKRWEVFQCFAQFNSFMNEHNFDFFVTTMCVYMCTVICYLAAMNVAWMVKIAKKKCLRRTKFNDILLWGAQVPCQLQIPKLLSRGSV